MKFLSAAFMICATLSHAGAATTILDPFSLAGDFGTTTGNVSANTSYAGDWYNNSGRGIALASNTVTGRPAGATDVYIGTLDHLRPQRLDLGYATVGTGEAYNISF